MANIFGIMLQNGHKIRNSFMIKETIKSLVRGYDGTHNIFNETKAIGISIVTKNSIYIYKNYNIPKELDIMLDKYIKKDLSDLIAIIGQTYDFLPPKVKDEDIHPIKCGNIISAVSGYCSNSDRVFEIYKLKKESIHNGEVIPKLTNYLYNQRKAPIKVPLLTSLLAAYRITNGNYRAITVCSKNPNIIWLSNRKETFSIINYPKYHFLAFSEKNLILEKSFSRWALEESERIAITDDKLFGIDLLNNEFILKDINER